MIGSSRGVFRIVVCEWHSIESDDLEGGPVELNIEITICRSIYDAPKLALARRNFDTRPTGSIHSENFIDFVRTCAALLRWNVYLSLKLVPSWIVFYGAPGAQQARASEGGALRGRSLPFPR